MNNGTYNCTLEDIRPMFCDKKLPGNRYEGCDPYFLKHAKEEHVRLVTAMPGMGSGVIKGELSSLEKAGARDAGRTNSVASHMQAL